MDQLELWDEQVQVDAAEIRDAARERWISARGRYDIGSAEELEAWNAYRDASERLAAILRAQREYEPAPARP